MKRIPVRPRLVVTADGKGAVGHAGARVLCDLADALGLTQALSVAMAPTKTRRRGHDRGQVLVDLAVMLADGGRTISDLVTLIDQPSLFGEVASVPTAWRTLGAIDDDGLDRIAAARAQARAAAWAAGADPGFYVIDLDATLVTAHSDKEGAAPTYKRGFGHHPLLAYLDATGEALAGLLRPGNAASNTTADHIAVLDAALAQLPVDPHSVEVVVRADSAGLSHGFVDACRSRQVRFAIGHDLFEKMRNACLSVPERRWRPAITADGTDERDGAEVAEITDLVDLSGWPAGTRAVVRREQPHPGAVDLHRHRRAPLPGLRHRSRRRRRLLPRGAASGPGTGREAYLRRQGLRSGQPAVGELRHQRRLAHPGGDRPDLFAWIKRLCLHGELARAEPKRLRYTLLHTAGVICRSGRRTRLRLAQGWPWSDELVAAFTGVRNLPLRI